MMWRPSEVILRDRNRAVCLWLLLIIAIISYTVVLIRNAAEDIKNPNTSFGESNGAYKYPDVMVCPYVGYGCDTMEDEDDCVYSSSTTQGVTQALFNPNSDEQQDIEKLADLTDDSGFCVTFYTSQLATPDGDPDPEDYIRFEVSWYPGGRDNASTTCIEQQGEWTSHSESITVFLRDSETRTLSTGMQLPYTCMTSESTSHVFNYMGIGLTKTVKLDSTKNSANYRAVTTYSYMKKENKDEVADIYNPYARFSLEVAREINSLHTITDNSVNYLEIFGEVGGAWDLLLILWPIFFVLAVTREPELKARNFRKSARRGSGLVRTFTTSVGFRPNEQRMPTRRTSSSTLNDRRHASPSASVKSIGSVTVHQSMSSRGMGMSSRTGQSPRPSVHSPPSRGSSQATSPHLQSAGRPASVVFTV